MTSTSRNSSRPAAETRARKNGAVTTRARSLDRLYSWGGHHRQMAIEAWQRFFTTPMANGMTVLMIAIALALPAALQLGLANFQRAVAGWEGQPQLSVFLHKRASEAAVQTFADKLRLDPSVAEVTYISPQQALVEFQHSSKLGDALARMEINPLPAVLLLLPRNSDRDDLVALAERVNSTALVDSVVVDIAWVQRLAQITTLGQRLSIGLAMLLALGVLLVVVNSIRLHIENRREEILVAKLVGATDAFVRRPFLYTGFCYGLFGGLLAWLLITVAITLLSGPVRGLASLYGSGFTLQGPDLGDLLSLGAGAGLLGLLGAWLAVARHISAIQPR